jgi:hypothetical protein
MPAMRTKLLFPITVCLVAAALAPGCGSGKDTSTSTSAGQSAGALSAEAQSAATGDIPDNQVFLTFLDKSSGYSMQYPEGWSQRGSSNDVKFQDKNNLVHVVVDKGSATTPSQVDGELAKLKKSNPTLAVRSAPKSITVKSGPAVKAVYSTRSAPNPVTGKRVTLVVDRYVLTHKGERVVVDLGTPQGVDNVDAYRQIIESFKWR